MEKQQPEHKRAPRKVPIPPGSEATIPALPLQDSKDLLLWMLLNGEEPARMGLPLDQVDPTIETRVSDAQKAADGGEVSPKIAEPSYAPSDLNKT